MIRRWLIGVLLIVGIVGTAIAIVLWREADSILSNRHHLTTALMQAAATAREIGASQEAYVAPGQPDQPWFDRTRELMAELTAMVDAAEGRLRAPGSEALVLETRQAIARLEDADARIQTAVLNGLDLSASDLIFTEAGEAGAAIVTALRAIDRAERDRFEANRSLWTVAHWALLSSAFLAWMAAAALWRVPKAESATAPPAEIEHLPVEADAVSVTSTEMETGPVVNLTEAADVCVQLSRIASAEALPGLLGRAAKVLDASGLILWMGAGEGSFPVTGHGYDERMLARLGPIRRHARNATAATWRTGHLRTVTGAQNESGAVAAPMFGVDGCFGVLTAEFRNGREGDPAIAAVAAMFAAQLSTIVPAWPAPSEAHEVSDQRPPMAASL